MSVPTSALERAAARIAIDYEVPVVQPPTSKRILKRETDRSTNDPKPVTASASSADFHLPGKHDQMSHAGGRAGHTLSNALKTLIPDDQDDDSLSFSEDDGRYFDWSSRDASSGIRSFEVGDADGETVQMGLQQEDMRQLASALSITLLRDQAVPPNPDDRQSMLLASLLQAGQRGGVTIGDSEDVDDTDRNFDWSTRGEGGSYHVEVSANGETAQLELSPDEMAQLHAQLVRTLLADEHPVAEVAPVVAATDGRRHAAFCRNPLHPGPCAKPGGKAYKRRHRGGDGPTGGGEESKQETPKAPAPPAPRKGSPKNAVPAGPAKYTGPRYVQPADVDAKAVTALRKRFHVDSPEAWSQGHVSGNLAYPRDDETEQLINQVGPTVATRLAWEADNEAALARMVQLRRPEDPNVGPYDDLPVVTDTELAQAKKAAGEQLREDFAGKAVSVRLTGESLDRVLDDGRFKTQFETKRSGGGYLPTKRAAAEKMMFGLDEDTDPRVRPVYGYLPIDEGPEGGESDLLDTYGDVQVILKDEVRSRTTASVGDSLDRQVLPSPVDDPSWESFNGAAHWSDGVAMDYGSQRGILYLEAQVHGGVRVEDIGSVAFAVAPSAATKKRLSDLGIPWRMR